MIVLPIFSKIEKQDLSELGQYLCKLSERTRSYFGPHGFNKEAIDDFYRDNLNTGYIVRDPENNNRIIAYAITRKGFLSHDEPRLSAYAIQPDPNTDATFAPSVADDCQGRGLGKQLFAYILSDLSGTGIARLILWGGVQARNERAVRYYQGLGFRTLGYFEYQGWNTDMVYDLAHR